MCSVHNVTASTTHHHQHLATMPVEGHLTHVSPYESIRKVKSLISRGDIWTQDVVLTVTSDEIVIKDGVTRVSSLHTWTIAGTQYQSVMCTR